MTGRSALTDLLFTVGYAEATTDQPMACRRPGATLTPQMSRGCPVWGTCKGHGVRHPGALGTDGDPINDPVRPFKTRWQDLVSQINKEDT